MRGKNRSLRPIADVYCSKPSGLALRQYCHSAVKCRSRRAISVIGLLGNPQSLMKGRNNARLGGDSYPACDLSFLAILGYFKVSMLSYRGLEATIWSSSGLCCIDVGAVAIVGRPRPHLRSRRRRERARRKRVFDGAPAHGRRSRRRQCHEGGIGSYQLSWAVTPQARHNGGVVNGAVAARPWEARRSCGHPLS